MDQATPPAARTAFAGWLAAELRARRLSQRGLAERAGINHSTIVRLLQGDHDPTLATATRIAEALRAGPAVETLANHDAHPSPVGRVRAALQADPVLREEDVAAVMHVYLTMRHRRTGQRRA